jgi:RNA polymerase sigma factor (sigma-70 family)
MDYWKLVWKDFKAGSNTAFEKIYYKFIDVLYRYGTKITTDRELVKDSIQQLFLELYLSKNISDPENIEYYLLKALKRIIMKRMNDKQKYVNVVENDLPAFAIELSPESLMIASEQLRSELNLINDSIQSLPPQKKELLYLKFYSGLNNKQIGLMLDMKPETVQKQIYRILKKLKVKFHEQFQEFFFLCLIT